MKTLIAALLLSLPLMAFAKKDDKPKDYQMGTFVDVAAADTGVFHNGISCSGESIGGYDCTGKAGEVYLAVYHLKTATGLWHLNKNPRGFGLSTTWQGPLDLNKPGDKVLFRVVTEFDRSVHIKIPYADDPNKEADYLAGFTPDVAPPLVEKPSDNVKTMCNSDKLTPAQKEQLCVPEVPATPPVANSTQPKAEYLENALSKSDPRIELFRHMCNNGTFKPGRDDFSIKQCDTLFSK